MGDSRKYNHRLRIAGLTCRRLKLAFGIFFALACVTTFTHSACAVTDADAWLRYTALDPKTAKQYEHLPSKIVVLGQSPVIQNAAQELAAGIEKMTGRTLTAAAVNAARGQG